jgi:hypothetical protein
MAGKAAAVNLEKSICADCAQHLEYPEEGIGQTIKCPVCGKPIHLSPSNRPAAHNSPATPVDSSSPVLKQRMAGTALSQLTDVTIRNRTKSGDTPLHRSAKTGRIDEIPKHFLQLELFMAANNGALSQIGDWEDFVIQHRSLVQKHLANWCKKRISKAVP